MDTIKLDYPVHTLDSRLSLPAGTELTPEALDELIASNKGTSYQALSFLEYGTIHKDLLNLLQKPPFSIMLNGTFPLDLMKNIRIILPVLECLNYFKENDSYTYQHSLAVFAMSINVARHMLEKPEGWIRALMAGAIHDIGKTCVPLKILKKADPLIRADRRFLEHHALAGYVLLSYFLKDYQSFAVKVAKEHHERRDGSGYPLGITLEDRMVEIIAVCDVYDALLSPRPYRPTPYDNRTALEEITEMAQKGKFRWDVVQTLVSLNRKDRPPFREVKISSEKRGKPPADNLYGVIIKKDMLKEIKCPNCLGSCKEKRIEREGVEYVRYECLSCGKEFDEDDLKNIEFDKE
jgi:HD-GYP domain-containing protein (c-di-GMP phosphodiesterase class II)